MLQGRQSVGLPSVVYLTFFRCSCSLYNHARPHDSADVVPTLVKRDTHLKQEQTQSAGQSVHRDQGHQSPMCMTDDHVPLRSSWF